MSDISNLRSTIIPKSDQLNADQLLGADMPITVTSVSLAASPDQPLIIHYDGENGRPFKPCKTMRKVLIALWGEDGNAWTGRSILLYCDTKVKWAGEEVGGIGSSYIAKHTPQLLQGITHAIAFDRKSTGSVITHMGFGGRCCSNEFANDFANKLNIGLFPDSTGVYTDTAEYTALIPECTNISAGYYSEHMFSEYTDYTYAQRLLVALLAAHDRGDLDTLVVSRDCDDLYDILQDDDDDNWGNSGNRYYDTLAGAAFGSPMTMLDIVKTHPQGVVSVLKEFGIDEKYLAEYIGLSVNY